MPPERAESAESNAISNNSAESSGLSQTTNSEMSSFSSVRDSMTTQTATLPNLEITGMDNSNSAKQNGTAGDGNIAPGQAANSSSDRTNGNPSQQPPSESGGLSNENPSSSPESGNQARMQQMMSEFKNNPDLNTLSNIEIPPDMVVNNDPSETKPQESEQPGKDFEPNPSDPNLNSQKQQDGNSKSEAPKPGPATEATSHFLPPFSGNQIQMIEGSEPADQKNPPNENRQSEDSSRNQAAGDDSRSQQGSSPENPQSNKKGDQKSEGSEPLDSAREKEDTERRARDNNRSGAPKPNFGNSTISGDLDI